MIQLATLRAQLGTVRDIEAAANVLEWDQETYMPDGAAGARAQQIATLRQLAHERFTADELAGLVDALAVADGLSEADAALVRVTRRALDRKRRLTPDVVARFAAAVSAAKQAWKKAREENAFPAFAPHLERLIDINVEMAEALGYDDRRYDALLEEYEPGMTTAEIETVFSDLRGRLVPIVQAIADAEPVDDGLMTLSYDTGRQWDFGMAVLRDIGYDFSRGRQDLSAHPFTTSFSITDVRLTTRVNERFLPSALFGTLHEAGHGLYEQGVAPAFDRSPLAEGASLGMHESQSRLWENLVGRSEAFWRRYYPKLQKVFPDQLGGVEMSAFYRSINRVAPSLIRVEADEVTYNLHIMLRFELETALIAGTLAVADLPAAWNAKMEDYLGIRPDTDADGVLQDIHWSLGVFGYFPTYSLGNLMSTQLFEQIQVDLPELERQIETGEFAPLREWLRIHVHQHGKSRDAGEILEQVTGQRLGSDSWIRYIEGKYGALYGL